MRSTLLALAFFLLLPISHAAAAEINEEGAQRLKTAFEKMIDYIDTVYGTAGMGDTEPLMTFEGDLQVTQNETFYSVIWPRMIYQEPSGTKVDLGVFAFNAIPEEKDGYWKMTMALPAAFTITPAEGEPIKINIGAQNAVGLFNEKMGYFTKLDATYENISLSGTDLEMDEFNIGNTRLMMNLEEDESGAFTGPTGISFNNITVKPSDEDISIKIGTLALDYAMSKFVPITLDEYKEKFLKHAHTFKSLNQIEQAENPEDVANQVDPKAIMDMVFDLYGFKMEGFDLVYRLENLQIDTTKPENLGKDDLRSFLLSKAFFGLGIGGLDSENGHMEIGLGYSGIDADPLAQDYKDAIPQNLKFKLRAEKIPVQVINEMGGNTLSAIAENPEMAQMAGFGFAMKLPAVLSQAGTRIVIEDNHLKNDLYYAMINGKITADMSAVSSAVGKINGVFEGLDALYALAIKNANNPALDKANDFKELVGTLDTLKSFGKPGTGPNGKPAYVYELELTPQGKLLLNGQDMTQQAQPQTMPQQTLPQASPPTNDNTPQGQDPQKLGEPL